MLCLLIANYRIQFVTSNLECSFYACKTLFKIQIYSVFLRLQYVKINNKRFKNINLTISSLTLSKSYSLYLIVRLNAVCIIL